MNEALHAYAGNRSNISTQHKTNQLCGDQDHPAISRASSGVIEVIPLDPLTTGDRSVEQLLSPDDEFGVYPQLFYCLITQELMMDPVIEEWRDRSAIEEWLARNPRSKARR